jgi:hypothetical protein
MALVTASKPLRSEKIRWKRRYGRLKERKKPPRERPRRKRVEVEFLTEDHPLVPIPQKQVKVKFFTRGPPTSLYATKVR